MKNLFYILFFAGSVAFAQEKINAQLVAEAEGRKRAAELDKQAADFTRQKDILLGQGEAERKRLIMSADGALNPKLDAWLRAQQVWADAFAKRNVPQTVMGNTGGSSSDSGAVQFMDIITAKAARDLSLDLSVPKGK